jgi:hypothetical protein
VAMKKQFIICVLLVLLTMHSVLAQTVEMADKLRADGKIYVVLAVILIILFGLLGYLWSIDNKIKKLEEQLKNNAGKAKQ